MFVLWQISLATLSSGMGEEEGRVAASSEPLLLQAGMPKHLEVAELAAKSHI